MSTTIFREFDFEAAHFLPCTEEGHPCARMHGHSYKVRVEFSGQPDPKTGWFLDWGDLIKDFDSIREALDHRTLNDVEGLANPTCELLAAWIWMRLVHIQGLSKIIINENPRCGVVYTGPGEG